MKTLLRACSFGALFFVGAALSFGVAAQAYPNHSIRLVVPFAAGGTTDILARAVAQKLPETMGQPVVVDNRADAAGNIEADFVAQ